MTTIAVDKGHSKRTMQTSEDWAVVVLGFLIIAMFVSGFPIKAPSFGWKSAEDLFSKVLAFKNLINILQQFLLVGIIASIGVWLTGKNLRCFLFVYPVVFLLTVLAVILAGNNAIKSVNLEAVIFSLVIGLLIGNLFKLPDWFRQSLTTELFVKIGLVLLGTSVIFSDILKAGSLGLVQALVVVLAVWYFAFWLCKQLKIDDEFNMMISSAVSICGVSAAIATAGAIKGDSKKLSYVISMVLITAIPMMILMPYLASWMGLSQEVTGAWLGGSIDTTGAVVASGTLVGETALQVSTIVKFSQNVLLGLAAFAISVYWVVRKTSTNGKEQPKPGLGLIWERFPKFVIGFILASLLFSFIIPADKTAAVKDGIKSIQGLWFALAFTSIGLETNFRDLFQQSNMKPLYAFLIAQLFNVVVTLGVAILLFG
jgi:uncharacterized integral membrane protein (TIGR00698 family)